GKNKEQMENGAPPSQAMTENKSDTVQSDTSMSNETKHEEHKEEGQSQPQGNIENESSKQKKMEVEAKEAPNSTASNVQALQSKSQPHVYQQFLSGENIFDQLLKRKQEAEQTSSNKTMFDANAGAGIGGEDEERVLDRRPVVGKPNDDGSEPVLTSASLNVAKHLGRCVQVMECLDPVSFEAFQALREAFNFYLYHVFVWFGVNVHYFFESTNKYSSTLDLLTDSTSTSIVSSLDTASAHNGMTSNTNGSATSATAAGGGSGVVSVAGQPSTTTPQKKYPTLTKLMNMVNDQLLSRTLAPELDDLIKKKLNGSIRRPKKLPSYIKLLMEASEALDLETDATMQGVAYRFVATETPFFGRNY
ncbi:hypothetical protein RFI_32482, partial [Reticulomyxa filosa]